MIHNHFDKAKRIARGVMMLSVGALLPFMTACLDEEVEQQPAADLVPLTLYLQTAESQQTRAYIGDLEDTNLESAINDVKAWVFQNGVCVAYVNAGSSDIVTEDGYKKVTAVLKKSVANGSDVDVYVIANAKSAGTAVANLLGEGSGLEAIQAATIDPSNFSAANPANLVTSVPTNGLPMSSIKKGCVIDLTTRPAKLDGPIKVTRAVSKICFAFGMYEGDFGEIVGISLEGSQIAASEYILPVDYSATAADYTNNYWGDYQAHIKAADGYETSSIIFGSTDGGTAETPAIAVPKADVPTTETDDNPANYAWDNWIGDFTAFPNNEKAAAYITAITPFITHKVYLRESDKIIKGKIYYRLPKEVTTTGDTGEGGTSGSDTGEGGSSGSDTGEGSTETPNDIKYVSFEMAVNQDFARNHVWIVYAYFEGGKLWVKPVVADWIPTTKVDYEVKMSTSMRLFDSWLYRYDTDGNYSDWWKWPTSHMVVARGTVEDPTIENPDANDRPQRSPLIQLVTTTGTTATGEALTLKLDNDKFHFVKATKNADGVVTAYSNEGTSMNIERGDNKYTYFYVVPNDDTAEGEIAKVTLVYTHPVTGEQKVPFNNSTLPGYSDDSSEIWVYCVAPTNYVNTEDGRYLKMYFQDINNPLVPTADQS